MKKRKLEIDFEYDFELFGISSSVKFYKLAWAINQKLDIRLANQPDYELEFVKDKSACNFSLYSYHTSSAQIDLFKNKAVEGDNRYLVPEFTHFDFILKYSDQLQSFATEVILKELKDVRWIEYISPLEVKTLKSKDNFLC